MNELKKNDLSFEERIKIIKLNNPGKFDHLPDPIKGSMFRNWSNEERVNFLEQIRNKKSEDESGENTKTI